MPAGANKSPTKAGSGLKQKTTSAKAEPKKTSLIKKEMEKQKKAEIERINSTRRKDEESDEEKMEVEPSEGAGQETGVDDMAGDPTALAEWDNDGKPEQEDPNNPIQTEKPETRGAAATSSGGAPKVDRSTKPEAGNPRQNGSNSAMAASTSTRSSSKQKHQNQPWQTFGDEQASGMDGLGGYQDHGQGYGQGVGHGQGQGFGQSQDRHYQSANAHQQHGYPRDGMKDQMQDLVFREAQASKQMVYGVFGNYITMMEEMESRELRKAGQKSLPRSDIHLPDQKKFDDDTIRAKLDTQLILLQCQLTSCHEAIKDEVKEELKGHTLAWSAAREDNKLPQGQTDKYAEKLFGLLEIGKADHPKAFYESPKIGEKDIHNALGAIMQGNQKKSELDQSFKDDRNKKATAPKTRKGETIDHGADRIARQNPKYQGAVDNHRSSWR